MKRLEEKDRRIPIACLLCATLLSLILIQSPAVAQVTNWALDFGEVEDYEFVEVGVDSRFDTDEITVEAWIKPTSLPQGHYIYEGRSTIIWNGNQAAGHDPYIFYINEYGCLEAHVDFVSGPPGLFIIDDTPVSLNEWHHVALVITSLHLKLYLDGDLVEELAHSRGLPDKGYSHVTIGRHRWYKNPFGGLMDEVRVWGVARTEEEINTLMYEQLTGGESGLTAYWDFNEGSGQVVHDLTANQIVGALGLGFGVEIYDPSWAPSDRPIRMVVSIDIRPCCCPNLLNLKSKGILPVAILGTEDLDVYDIDVATVDIEGVGPIRSNYEDVATPFDPSVDIMDCYDCTSEGPDGYTDLTLKFDTQEVVTAIGAVTDGECLELWLTGELSDGTPIEGVDVVLIRKKGK